MYFLQNKPVILRIQIPYIREIGSILIIFFLTINFLIYTCSPYHCLEGINLKMHSATTLEGLGLVRTVGPCAQTCMGDHIEMHS